MFSIFFIVDTIMLSGFPYEFNKSLLFKIISPIFHCIVRIYLCFFIYPILLLDECGYKSIIYITLALLFNYLVANTLLLALMALMVGLFIVIYKTKIYDIVRNLPSQFYQNLKKYFDYKVLVNLFAIIATINFLAFIIGPIIFLLLKLYIIITILDHIKNIFNTDNKEIFKLKLGAIISLIIRLLFFILLLPNIIDTGRVFIKTYLIQTRVLIIITQAATNYQVLNQ